MNTPGAVAIDQVAKNITDFMNIYCGSIVTTGVGKSGHVALNVASTFSTLGVPAVFIHAEDALHGELGFITGEEVVIAFSASGATGQTVSFTHTARERGCLTVAVIGIYRALGTVAECVLMTTLGPGADEWVVPTASLVAQLAVGHALAVAVAEQRGTGDVSVNHPGGYIGGQR
ncbi:MAG: SIS domain-containing protein [Vicinamibacterales bacterium]